MFKSDSPEDASDITEVMDGWPPCLLQFLLAFLPGVDVVVEFRIVYLLFIFPLYSVDTI